MADQPTVDEMGAAALGVMFGDYDGTIIDATAAGASSDGDTSAATVDTGQPRGADGKFLPKAEEITPEPEGYTEEVPAVEEAPAVDSDEEALPADAGTEPEEEDGDLVLDADMLGLSDDHILFTKYGGDLSKALEALTEAQSTIGRQGSELGELREIRDQVDSLQQLITLQQQGAGIDWDEVIENDPQQAVLLAAQYQNTMAFEQAIEAWAAVEPIKAFTFLQQISAEADQAPPTTLDAEMDSLKQRFPDIQQRLPAIQEEAGKRPALARLLNDEDPRTRAQALEDLYHLSRGASTADTSTAARRIILQAKAEADSAKADAAVVSASNTAPPPPPPPSGDDALRATLQEYLGLGDDFKIVG